MNIDSRFPMSVLKKMTPHKTRPTVSTRHLHRWHQEHPVVTLRVNGDERSFKISPVITTTLAGLCALLIVAVFASTGYLFLRDDLANATIMRQATMRHLYEDRITNLRSQVDLATSRQMLNQQEIENRVAKLLMRQDEIGAQQQQFNRVYSQATPNHNELEKPRSHGTAPEKKPVSGTLRLGALIGTSNPFNLSQYTNRRIEIAHGGSQVLDTVEEELQQTERFQIAEIKKMKKEADLKVRKLSSILSKQGIRVPDETAIGGPLIELKSAVDLAQTIHTLDASLELLGKMRKAAYSLPHGSPSPGQKISSRYGSRKDPFTGRAAVHGGLDYKAKYGTPVRATASGTIIKAGRLGGYGKMIEIQHADGITTRYAHLSKIKVKRGERVVKGTRIGNVGSTGRSTGPHLHYEVRRKGRSLNPIHFVNLEERLKPYL
jgi:murein DD-endopeptidase MepM/ murein hydrolase activator NlpD